MNLEINRLNTFSNWPMGAPVDPIPIAKGGFFYTGQGTEVECFSCGGKISQWNYGDQVMMRHRRMDPNCPFVVNPQMAGNEPLVLDRAFTTQSAAVPVSAPVPDELVTNSQDAGPTEEDEMYKSDALRLLSFINWQDDSISREALVNAGFYHAGEGRLRCAWCGGELAPFRNLGSLGAPVDIHRRYFPRCDYALRLDNAYRASNISPPFSPPHTPQVESPRNSVMSEGALHNSRLLARNGQNCTQLGVVGVSGPGVQHPALASLAARLATFAEWPRGRPQGPDTLAEAGFFYTGQDDQVCCFYCDGGLGKWEASDEPWAEHARWFPGCGFVQLVKGADFVAQHRAGQLPPRAVSTWAEHARWFPGCGFVQLVKGADFVAQHRAGQLPPRAVSTWAEHARWFPGCGFVQLVKGADFVAQHRAGQLPPRAVSTWAEHARWFPGCGFVQLVKGADFVAQHRAGQLPPRAVSTWAEHARWFPGCGFVQLVKGADFVAQHRAGQLPPRAVSTWAEHARWFPGCGFVQLVKGADFVAQHRAGQLPPRARPGDRSVNNRQRNPSVNFPVNESQVEEQMDSQQALVALGAGLDAARVRRAIRRRLQTTGLPFTSSEALIDAVLDEQLNEESWGVTTNQRFARDILAEALREFAPAAGLIPSPDCDQTSQSESSSRSRTPNEPQPSQEVIVAHADTSQTARDPVRLNSRVSNDSDRTDRVESEKETSPVRKKLSLEEENRQLKEARLCKVCMDSEVSVVFLPCGHLVSCARCGAALASCPLCREPVRALVRAYLA
ncbi:death-associated inhibitor of apoptosis 2 [Cydia strobilella]|uniref:death-associated inhibitor of apoptosis 2 n=1 Tax=Cydia strobilella TaxID=1100964 RepID=UPI003006B694